MLVILGPFSSLFGTPSNTDTMKRMLRTTLLCATILLTVEQALAQEVVYGSVVLSRTGQRTPIFNSTRDVTTLTNTGAWQSRNAGAAVRSRYLNAEDELAGLSASILDPLQVYALSSDGGQYSMYSMQSAQAFMQGLFPATTITNDTAPDINPLNVQWDGSYTSTPNGVQYSSIHTAGQSSSDSIYLDGTTYCPAFVSYYSSYIQNIYNSSPQKDEDLYGSLGSAFSDATVPSQAYAYWDAWYIYDYVSYQYSFNRTVHDSLSSGPFAAENAYNRLRWNSDTFLSGAYASSTNDISTLSGRTLATKVLELLSTNIASSGEQAKVSLLFSDFQPLLSFFSLAGLPGNSGDNFTGLPSYGSYAIFELFTFTNGTEVKNSTSPVTGAPTSYPALDDLYVRFLFANGSDTSSTSGNGEELQPGPATQYPIFVRSSTQPETAYITWEEFSTAMEAIALGTGDAGNPVKDWCGICDAWVTSEFCLYNNETAWEGLLLLQSGGAGKGLDKIAAGAIGAVVGMLFLALVMAIVWCVGGVGLARRREPLWRRRDSAGPGFKGGQKMASDPDLRLVKGGAAVGVTEKPRVGSWELKSKTGDEAGAGRGCGAGLPHIRQVSSMRGSFEHFHEQDEQPRPYSRDADGDDDLAGKPVRPRESV